MKKSDELQLFMVLRIMDLRDLGFRAEAAGAMLGIPEKRLRYLLLKWTDNGWWDYGIRPELGWLAPEAPFLLTP